MRASRMIWLLLQKRLRTTQSTYNYSIQAEEALYILTISSACRLLIEELINFPKLIIAAVNGMYTTCAWKGEAAE